MEHDYEMEPKLEQVSFINGKDWNENGSLSLINQPQFGSIGVNINSSAVHLPLQVYEGCKLFFSYQILFLPIEILLLPFLFLFF